MAKKGNININKKDFNFDGDEMFPLDDSVFDDDFDELSGFKFDPKGEEVTGVRGFFKNSLKSIKGLGLDFVDQFVPELTSLSDDAKMALSESLDSFVEGKDKALNKMKDMISKKPDGNIMNTVKGAFKNSVDNLKKGKFYIGERDKTIDLDSFMGDDNDDDEDGYEEDTSGKMTTSFNYKTPRKRKGSKLIINNDNSGMINAMVEMQQSATVATGAINTKLANRQLRASNEHSYASIKILNNIADNVYGISNFLTHYGKTDLKAQLEYDSKSLAFLTDQRALLKDILRGINTANGIAKKAIEEDDENEKRNFMKFGSFDMSKYFNHIKGNAKDMFLGTDIGMGFEMLSSLSGMMGKGSGLNIKMSDMIPSLMKGFLFNQMIGTKTKAKLERLNDMFGNIGGTLVTKANKWKDSDNSVLGFLGNLLGTDTGINKYLDMNKVDVNQQSPLDIGTKESINVVIPGYLSKIVSALTGEEETYFDHQTKRFRTNSSLKKRYEQSIETAMSSHIDFSSGINAIEGGLNKLNKDKNFYKKNKNYKPLSDNDIQKAIDKFKNNLVDSKTALDPYMLATNKEYSEKLFKGFQSIGKENSEQLKDMIINQVSAMSKAALYDLNNSIFKVAREVEDSSRKFKEDAMKYGGLGVMAQINDEERWAEMDYQLKYSSHYNEKYAGKNEFNRQRARIAAATAKRDMFNYRGGNVDLVSGNEVGSITHSAYDKISNIFDLLAGGIVVYPITDPELTNKRIGELGKIVSANNAQKEQRKKAKIKEENLFKEMRKINSETAAELAQEEKIRKQMTKFKGSDNSFMNNLREVSGIDALASGFTDVLAKPLEMLLGKETVSEMLESGGNDKETLRMAEERYKASKLNAKQIKRDAKEILSKKGKGSKKGFLSKVGGVVGKTKDRIGVASSKINANLQKAAAKAILNREKAAAKRQKDIAQRGSFMYQTMGSGAVLGAHNAKLSVAGSQRATIYIDPMWWDSMDDKSSVKILWTSVIQANNLKVVDYLDESVDIAVAKSFDKADKEIISSVGIRSFPAKKDSAQSVASYVNSKNFSSDIVARNRKRNIKENNAIRDYNERDVSLNKMSISKYEFGNGSLISKIKNSKDAASLFLDRKIQSEIDDLLASGDEDAIMEFANKIKSDTEGMTFKDPESAMRHLDPKFKKRLNLFFADPEIAQKGVSIKDSIRTPLKQFAFYTKGRINPAITDKLLKLAGVKEGINYYPENIRTIMGSDGITARSLASNHMTGRAADINNGTMPYKKLSFIAGKYGLKWGGEKDKPHFEYDTKWKKGTNSNYTGKDIGGDSGKMSATGAASAGAQHDPGDTKVSGKAITSASVKNPFKSGDKKFFADRLISMEQILERIARNTETIGFGIGIPGVVGKGLELAKKTGATAIDLSKKAFGFAKESLITIKDKGMSSTGGALSWGKNKFNLVKDKALELKDKFMTDISKMSMEEIIIKFDLEEKLGMSMAQIKKTYGKAGLVALVKSKYSGLGGLKTKALGLKDKALGYGQDLFERGKGLAGAGLSWAKGMINTYAPGAKEFALNAYSKGKEYLGKGFSGIKELAGKGAGFLKDTVSNFKLPNIFSGIGGLFGGGLFGGFDFQNKILAKLDEIDRDIFLANGKVKPDTPAHTSGSIGNPDIEGSYADQKDDKSKAEKLERADRIDKNIAAIAAAIGTPTSAILAANGNVEPEPTLTSMAMASYQNSEKQNEVLSDISKNAGKGGGLLGGAAGVASKIGMAGAGLTIAAAGAGAAMAGKQIHNKIKSVKANWKQASFGEKISEVMGGGGSSNYDTAGNRIEGGAKAGAGFGLNQAVHMMTFAKGVSKIMPLFQKIISKIFSNPKIVAKLGGKAAAGAVQKGFLATMKQAFAKGMGKVAGKITAFTTKVSNPVGWGVFIAQLLYDITSGMSDADRYFKMGKGMKPTWPMRIAAGMAKALSGNLTFGLVPPETIANLVFNAVGDKGTKNQMASAAEFDKKRAAIMEVDYNRLVEFETMTWTEMLFGGDKKRATILGFIKDKHDKDGINRFKTWMNDVYTPLDDMYKSMIKEYGGNVNKKISPEDTDGMERVAEFRNAYIASAQKYMKDNDLYGLGPLGKKNKNDEQEKREYMQDKENIAVANASGKAELAKQGIDAVKVGSTAIGDSVKSGVAENAQADGINYNKLKKKSMAQNFKEGAKENIKETAKIESAKAGRFSGFKNKLKSITSSKGFKAVRDVAAGLVTSAVPALNIFKGVKGAADAIAQFIANRRDSEASIASAFNSKEGESQILSLQSKIVDKKRLGQQTSIASLTPEFASRIEAFLKDPRVINHGVSIREGYRSPATQLAYFSKGRAPRKLTDKLMKQAGFASGINFWPSSFQKPGDYITWTLASNHFNGTAVDLNPGDLGYDKLGAIAAEYGIEWGGNWANPDKPHFEMGDPSFNIGNTAIASIGGGTSIAEGAQADAINYGSAASRSKPTVSVSRIGRIHKPRLSRNISSMSVTARAIQSSSRGTARPQSGATVTSNLVENQFNMLLDISSEGVEIMRKLYEEQVRHNKVAEETLGNILKGIGALGAIIASNNGGNPAIPSFGTGITKGAFDNIAKGL